MWVLVGMQNEDVAYLGIQVIRSFNLEMISYRHETHSPSREESNAQQQTYRLCQIEY